MNNETDYKKVVLGLSGGVDSAVAAYLLKEQGYEVFCVYLKNWTEPDEHGVCPALRDREDAMRVAAKLDLPFQTVDYEKEYRDRVFAPFVDGLNQGVNPNPDVLCNPLVKFIALGAIADQLGAAWIATGHYARVEAKPHQSRTEASPLLLVGRDQVKDQSYFLSRITKDQLRRTLFPIGELTKPEVRTMACKAGLHVSAKEGTSGICFIGERNFENFMKDKVISSPGPIIDTDGQALGEHRGLPFYTVGQRHGFGCPSASSGRTLGTSGGEPYYVAKKDLKNNTLVVARAYDPALFRAFTLATGEYWINGAPNLPFKCQVRLRYRQSLQSCTVISNGNDGLKIDFDEPQKAVTPGQYAAFYDGDTCLGSAVLI
jgi:tRNA-specific 2-thiouridylase